MHTEKMVGKREFIQHTSKYLNWVEQHDDELIITHHNQPDLVLTKFKPSRALSFKDLRGLVDIKIPADINEPVLPGYDEW